MLHVRIQIIFSLFSSCLSSISAFDLTFCGYQVQYFLECTHRPPVSTHSEGKDVTIFRQRLKLKAKTSLLAVVTRKSTYLMFLPMYLRNNFN